MNECEKRGCRNLEWKCGDCGRTRATAIMVYGEWISVEDRPAPAMQTVILCYQGKSIVGWNESVQPEEDPAYCSWEPSFRLLENEDVTHWMPLPKPPKKEN
jgi:hypothetical protein